MSKNSIPAKREPAIKGWWESGKGYIRGVYSELKKVHWPNRRQLLAYTGVVIVAVLIIVLIMWLFDTGLSFVLQKLFDAFA